MVVISSQPISYIYNILINIIYSLFFWAKTGTIDFNAALYFIICYLLLTAYSDINNLYGVYMMEVTLDQFCKDLYSINEHATQMYQ
jgi:hypothetical protein